jgi:SAM-dependent methyltransferase
MSRPFSDFDARHYKTVGVKEGYEVWSSTYDTSGVCEIDIDLLRRFVGVDWTDIGEAIDLGCGTGRTGTWLKEKGVGRLDGVDLTPAMLRLAKARGIYDRLVEIDMTATGLDADAYDLAASVLAVEHLADLGSLYREAARLVRPQGWFIVVGFHPYFLLNGIPTHFDLPSGEPLAIENHVHLFSDHVTAAQDWTLECLDECRIDDAWAARKRPMQRHLHRPVSFLLAWRRRG